MDDGVLEQNKISKMPFDRADKIEDHLAQRHGQCR